MSNARLRAEVSAGGLETGREIAALADLMQMRAVPARRQRTLGKFQSNQDALGQRAERGLANRSAARANNPSGSFNTRRGR